MSHSDKKAQYKLELYQLQQAAIAGRLHSQVAQPIVAAKNFAAAILNIEGDAETLREARELATIIVEMTDQAYTAAYDLMRETEVDVDSNSNASMRSSIEYFGTLLRLSNRGIKLTVAQDLSLISMDRFAEVVVLDWIKTLLVYLARQTQISVVSIKLIGICTGLNIEIESNMELSPEYLESEVEFVNIHKQLKVLFGTLTLGRENKQTCMRMSIPLSSGMLKVTL